MVDQKKTKKQNKKAVKLEDYKNNKAPNKQHLLKKKMK